MANTFLAMWKASQSRVQQEEQASAAEAASPTSHSLDQKPPTPPKTSAESDHVAETGPSKKKSGKSKKSRSRRSSVVSDSDEPLERDFVLFDHDEPVDPAETASSTSHNPGPPDEEAPNTVFVEHYIDRNYRSLSQRRKARKARSRRDSALLDSDSDEPPNLSLTLDGSGQTAPTSVNNMFPSFLDTNSSNSGPNNSMQRPSPLTPQQQQNQVNGTGSGMNGIGGGMSSGMGGLPMNAGQQMDVNMLYQKVVELSEVLRDNREKTQGIVAGAEELATRAAASGASPSLQEANTEISAARIADLERQLAREQNKTRTMLREQKENTKLIGEYETAVGNIVEMVRNYSFNNKAEKTTLQLHYNKLLQEEKDAHLEARLEKDHWHSKFMRSVGMLREAYRLRCEEEDVPTRIVAGLQNEVRAYRNALGMDKERPEDEFGWEILKDVVDRGDD